MKPLVYFDFVETENNKVMVDKERLRKILDEVYQAGYDDGRNAPKITTLNSREFESNKINAIPVCSNEAIRAI
mgnify:FL=1